MKRPALSIPTRIFLAFVVSFVAFAAILVGSVVEHQRTAKSLRLMEEGYVPLAITVGEAKATQSLFATLLDRFLKESDPTATRHWLNTARKLRPTTVRRALYNVDRAFRLKPDKKDAAALERVRGELRGVEDAFRASDARYDRLFSALVEGRTAEAAALLGQLQNDERLVRDRLRRARDVVESRLASYSASVAEREQRTTVSLLILTSLALGLAVFVTWWTQRVLSPIPLLGERVAAVAAGDFESRLEVRSKDELGRLAAEFERMVDALRARDASLRDAHEEQLRTRARLLESERLAAMGRMAAHVTHEVRNPLSSIRLNVELLEEDLGSAQKETKEILEAIQREVDRLTGLTEEYLRLARIPDPELHPEDIVALVESVRTFVAREMAEAKVDVRLTTAPALPEVAVDEQQIRQVFLNL
ncbi:MAG: histidine kinase dimerization/phospho-acceptor domain-containing protein, partial [Polyangiales bacterium]